MGPVSYTHLLENKVLYQILDKLINFFRSIPFIILLTWVIPISRAIMGTAINVEGAICLLYTSRCV